MPDGKEYLGAWRKNRMHGKGTEKLPNGEKYLVFSNNGKRIDFLTLGKEESTSENRGGFNIVNQSYGDSDRERFLEKNR